MPDVRLTCVMLRALWGLGIMDCVGIMVSLDPHAQPDHAMAGHPATPRHPAATASGAAVPPASEGAAEEGAKWRRKLSRTAASSASIVTSASLAPQWDPASPEGARRGRRGSEGGKSGPPQSPGGSQRLGEGERERPRARRHTSESCEREQDSFSKGSTSSGGGSRGGSRGDSYRAEEEEEEGWEADPVALLEEEELLEQAHPTPAPTPDPDH